MKAILILASLILTVRTVSGQGTIDFRNTASVLPSPPDRLVRRLDGTPLVGTQYVAQLFYVSNAPAHDRGLDAPAAVVEPPSLFRTPPTALAGMWQGGTRTLTNAGLGVTVTLVVRAWDATFGTYGNAFRGGGLVGQSQPFTYTVPSSPLAGPSAFYMVNFVGFAIQLPPQITSQPASQIAECGNAATFTVEAGSVPSTYRWYYNQTTLLSTGPLPSYTIANAQFTHAGSYHVVISNNLGWVTSAAATLTVVDTTSPSILACPPSRALPASAACRAVLPNLAAEVVATDSCGAVTVAQNPPPEMVFGLGSHPVTFNVTDSSGNATSCVATITVVDVTPPMVTGCAPDQTVSVNEQCQGLVPDLTGLVRATDNCGTLTVAQTPLPGTLLAPGAVPVTLVVSDAAGNSATCTATLTVRDATPPTITTCAGNRTLPANAQCQAAIPDLTSEVVALDNCGVVTVSQNPPAGTLVALGSTVVTLTASDTAGNTITCNAPVTVSDTTAPVITTCAPNQTVAANAQCQAALPDLAGHVSANDNCGAVTITQTPAAGALLPLGATLIRLTATDGAGNITECTTTVTVTDTTPPTITACAPNRNVPADATCHAPLPDLTGDVTASDNCGTVTVTQTPIAGTPVPLGPATVTLTVSDTAGNASSCSATVTVNDVTAPMLVSCATDRVLVAGASCTALLPDLASEVVAADLCGQVTISQAPAPGAPLGLGAHPITLNVTDTSGNSTSCVATVTVVDQAPPAIAACAPNQVLSANEQCRAAVPDLTALVTATDNCSATLTIVQSPSPGAFIPLGTTTVTLMVSDAAGNAAECRAALTVNDTTAPVITTCAPSRVLSADAECQAIVPDLTGDVVAHDNCSMVTVTQNPPAGALLPPGATVVTLTASDAAGNVTTCMTTLSVTDTTEPSIVACTLERELSADEQCLTLIPDLTAEVVATDNCNSLTVTQSPPPGVAVPLGATQVTLTISDSAGNSTNCVTTIRVVDTTPPTITTCASDQTLPANGECQALVPDLTGAVRATENCSSVPITQHPPPGSSAPLGATLLTFTATDMAGNSATCTATLSVIDTTPPVIIACAPSRNLPADADCQAIVPDVRGDVVASDNCGPVTITQQPLAGSLIPLGATMVTITASDAAGNTTTCATVLAVQDTTAPVIITCAPDRIATANPECEATVPDLSGEIVASDNCVGFTMTQEPRAGSFVPLGPTTITITIADIAGNSTTCTTTFTVADTTPPTLLTCPPDRSLPVNAECRAAVPDLTGELLASDNCSAVTVTQLPAPGTLVDPGPTQVELTATDAAGNSARCTSLLTVVDTTPPGIVCPGDITLTIAAAETQIAVDYAPPSATDNCTAPFFACHPPSGGVFPAGANIVTCVATDSAGNTAQCVFNIVVNRAPSNAPPPIVLVSPPSTNVALGGSAQFCAAITSASPVTIQWRRNGVNLTDETNVCLNLLNVQLPDGGSYDVIVANDGGITASEPVFLFLDLPERQGSDGVETPIVVPEAAGTVSGANTNATVDPEEPRHAGKSGGKSIWYEWTAPATGIAVFDTIGSTFDTLLAVYVRCGVELTEIASDEDSGGNLTSKVQFNAFRNTTYLVAVDGFAGAEGQFAISWNFQPAPDLLPIIRAHPENATVGPGGTATFAVVAIPVSSETLDPCLLVPPILDPIVLEYQWALNGHPIEGATSPVLVIDHVQDSDVGDYVATVSQAGRPITSRAATLQINVTGTEAQNVRARNKFEDAAEEPGIELGGAPVLPLPAGLAAALPTVVRGYTGSQVFNTAGSTTERGDQVVCQGVVGGASQWITFVPQQSGVLHINTDGSSYNTVMAVFVRNTNNPPNLVRVVCDNNSGLDGRDSALSLPVQAGVTNYLMIDGVNGQTGVLRLNYSLVVPASIAPLGSVPGGQIHLRLTGRSNLVARVEVSSNLVDWAALIITNSLSGTIDIRDEAAPPQRFYRAVMLP